MAGNLVPRTDGGADLGTASKEWNKVYAKELGGTLAGIVAPLANPGFTGVPTAPTAASGTSTTQLATTKFVVDEIADNLAGSIVPGTDGTANLGSASKEYNKIYAKELGGTLAGLVARNDTSQRGTAYSVGDAVRMPGVPVNMYLECTTAGTTGATAPTITTPVAAGDTVTDGTAEWTVRKCASKLDLSAYLPLTGGGALSGTGLTWNGDDLGGSAIVAKSLDERGYIKHVSGLIEQWGYESVSAGKITITFPITFPSGNYTFVATGVANSTTSGKINITQLRGASATSVPIYITIDSGGQWAVNWRAIGY